METRTDFPVKLILNEDNFNFDLAQSDGFDFRLAERSNGSGILKMWVAKWDKDNKHAVLWFKIPLLLPDSTVIFYAFWGGDYSDDVSIPEELNFLFYEDFETIPLLVPGVKVNNQTMSHSCSSVIVGFCYNTSDDNEGSYWLCNDKWGWNRVDLGSGNEQQIDGVRLHGHGLNTMPNDFTIFGSNNDSDWDELYFGKGEAHNELQYFPFGEVVGPYRYYRFWAYNNHGATYLGMTIIHYCIGMELTPKWEGRVDGSVSTYGYLFPSNLSFTTITNPLVGSWKLVYI